MHFWSKPFILSSSVNVQAWHKLKYMILQGTHKLIVVHVGRLRVELLCSVAYFIANRLAPVIFGYEIFHLDTFLP